MTLLTDLLTLLDESKAQSDVLLENPKVEAKYEKLKQALLDKEEELLQILADMGEKVKAGEFDEAIHLARDFVSLANKANDLNDKLPEIKS